MQLSSPSESCVPPLAPTRRFLDRAVNSINVLNNNFAASAGIGIIANYGEVIRIAGNCFESLGGPAIYANQIGALTISGSYYEANNLNAAAFRWTGQAAGPGLCAEVVRWAPESGGRIGLSVFRPQKKTKTTCSRYHCIRVCRI